MTLIITMSLLPRPIAPGQKQKRHNFLNAAPAVSSAPKPFRLQEHREISSNVLSPNLLAEFLVWASRSANDPHQPLGSIDGNGK